MLNRYHRIFACAGIVAVAGFGITACAVDVDDVVGEEEGELGVAEQGVTCCIDKNLGSYTGTVFVGDTCAANNSFTPSCASFSNTGDFAFTWTAPATDTYTFSTFLSGIDTVIELRDYATDAVLACNDDHYAAGPVVASLLTRSLTAGQTVVVIVDGYADYCGQIKLSIIGTTCPSWTQWYDADNPSGTGDFEGPPPCTNPTNMQTQTTGGVGWSSTGEYVEYNPKEGARCYNPYQPDSACLDYRVRYCCP